MKKSVQIIYILVFSLMTIPVICLAGINDELYEAVRSNNQVKIIELISNGADVNAKDSYGWTPLMKATDSNKIEIMKLLIENGADVNAKNTHGRTPLMYVCTIEAVKLLIENGADVNAKDSRGWTPLMSAVEDSHGETEVLEFFLDKGADVNAKTIDGKTVLSVAKSRSDTIGNGIVEFLKKAGAKR